jgi:hypothetical protein
MKAVLLAGGTVKRIHECVDGERLFCAIRDGLSDVDGATALVGPTPRRSKEIWDVSAAARRSW